MNYLHQAGRQPAAADNCAIAIGTLALPAVPNFADGEDSSLVWTEISRG